MPAGSPRRFPQGARYRCRSIWTVSRRRPSWKRSTRPGTTVRPRPSCSASRSGRCAIAWSGLASTESTRRRRTPLLSRNTIAVSRRSRRAWLLDDVGVPACCTLLSLAQLRRTPARHGVTLLVIHNISLPPGRFKASAVMDLFTESPGSAAHPYFTGLAGLRVSAHFFVRRRGDLDAIRPMLEAGMACGSIHLAGSGALQRLLGRRRVGRHRRDPFTAAQYRALTRLTRVLKPSTPSATSRVTLTSLRAARLIPDRTSIGRAIGRCSRTSRTGQVSARRSDLARTR